MPLGRSSVSGAMVALGLAVKYPSTHTPRFGAVRTSLKRGSTMVKKEVTKPASSLCNGQVNRVAREAMEAKVARIKRAVDLLVEAAEKGKKK